MCKSTRKLLALSWDAHEIQDHMQRVEAVLRVSPPNVSTKTEKTQSNPHGASLKLLEIRDFFMEFQCKEVGENVVQSILRKLQMAPRVTPNAVAYPEQNASSALVCPRCKNAASHMFVHVPEVGDIVCECCGTVVVEHMLFEGEQERTFQKDENGGADAQDRSHVGRPNRWSYLLSDSYGLRTYVEGGMNVTGHIRKVIDLMRTDGSAKTSTTDARRDRDKLHAIHVLQTSAWRLGVCKYACNDAIEMFSRVRDAKEHVLHKELCMALCLYVCHEAQIRRRPLMTPTASQGFFICPGCDGKFLTASRRIHHFDVSTDCRKTFNASAHCQTHKKRRVELDFLQFE